MPLYDSLKKDDGGEDRMNEFSDNTIRDMKKHRQIGILTFWNVPNYGTFMQAYALQHFLQEMFPNDDIRQIRWLDDVHYDAYYAFINRSFRGKYINPRFYAYCLERRLQKAQRRNQRKFLDYYPKFIPHTTTDGVETESPDYDILVLGSDIIWDYSIGFFHQDKHLFGHGFHAKKKISYAASFGTVKPGQDVPSYVLDGISQLDAISVRDENSVAVVHSLLHQVPQVVLDPTLLMDFQTDIAVVSPVMKEKYIGIYGDGFSDEMKTGARDYADRHGMKLVCIDSNDDTSAWCDRSFISGEMNPFELLGWFKGAEAIMTSTYHGLMFSLNFHKPIIFQPTTFILDKVSSLIHDLSLWEPLVAQQTFSEKVSWEWDYDEIEKCLSRKREASIQFLRESISV